MLGTCRDDVEAVEGVNTGERAMSSVVAKRGLGDSQRRTHLPTCIRKCPKVLGGPWAGTLCHLDLPTWITHTALAVNNHPLYSLYNPLHVPSVGTSALQRLYSSTALYSPLQLYSSTSSTVYIPLHPPSERYAHETAAGHLKES